MMALVMQQGWLIQRELWKMQRMIGGNETLRRSLATNEAMDDGVAGPER
jgi:hypothetical protein